MEHRAESRAQHNQRKREERRRRAAAKAEAAKAEAEAACTPHEVVYDGLLDRQPSAAALAAVCIDHPLAFSTKH